MNKIAIVDIDNTLWDFATELYKRLKTYTYVPPVSEWKDWDFWENYIDEKLFLKTIDEIHFEQENFEPFPDARKFLEFLKKKNYLIYIVSWRNKKAYESTKRWFEKYEMPYNEIICVPDTKLPFIKKGTLIIDDAPHILETAKKLKKLGCGLEYPWNKELKKEVILEPTLKDLLKKLKNSF